MFIISCQSENLLTVYPGDYKALVGKFSAPELMRASGSKGSIAHIQVNLVNVSLPHRIWLVDKIFTNLEITSQRSTELWNTSVLEIGCGCGANLEVITRRMPSLRLVGVDINPASIAVGSERFTELGL